MAGEVALSLVLVCGAALLFRTLVNLQRFETGVRIEHVITLSVDLPLHAYPTPESAAVFYEAVTERLAAVPGVHRTALSSHLPLLWIGNGEGLRAAGRDEMIDVRFKRVDAAYFDVLDVALRAGRGITPRDRAGARQVVVINEALAARLAADAGMKDPLGHVVRLGCPRYAEKGAAMADVEIVGIVRNERVASPGTPEPPVVYVPLAQVPRTAISVLVRTQLEADAVMPGIREAIRRVDSKLAIGNVATMQQVQAATLSTAKRPAWLIGTFAAVAGLLAALGLYGVVAHGVTQQRREIGIRLALGASPGEIVLRVLRNALSMVAFGLGLGVIGTLGATRVMESLLFQVSPRDPFALALACLAMILIGLIAGYVPARTAAAVQPAEVLRGDL